MTYRNELEAALQRANALEREVTALRKRQEPEPLLRAKVEALQRQLQQANERLKELQPLPPEAQQDLDRARAKVGAVVAWLVLGGLVGLVVVLMFLAD